MELNSYKPLKGFYDLRDFNIPNKTIFNKLAKMQLTLASVNTQWQGYTKEQKEANKLNFRNWQNASAELQQILFSFGELPQYKLNLIAQTR